MEDACRKGDLEQVRTLLSVDVRRASHKDGIGVTPLHRACAFNHVEIAELLLECKADVQATDRYGETPLKRAAYDGHVDAVSVLLNAGADVNHEDMSGKAAIHHAAEQGRSQVLEVLIESGAKINHDTREYYTPLHLAALNGHAFCCRVLINGGTFIDAQGGHQNSTPLHLAADGGHAQAARILIEEGADLTLLDRQARRPALLAKTAQTRDLFDSVLLINSVHAASCTVEGPGLDETIHASDNCMFVIYPHDRYGKPMPDPGGFLEFSAEIQDVKTGVVTKAEVTPNAELCCSVCHYDGSVAGDYLVHVRLDNGKTEGKIDDGHVRQPVKGSPFMLKIVAAAMDPYSTRAIGDGLLKPPAGQPTSFVVKGRDRYNNKSAGGEINVYMAPHNMKPMDLTITDQGDGDHRITYTAPPESGRVALSVAIEGGAHIYNSPFTVFVMPGEVVADKSDVDGKGIIRTGVDLISSFMIHPRDVAGNHLIYGGLNWQVKVYPEESEQTGLAAKVDVEIEDHGDGCYTCIYKPMQACIHAVRVMLDNKHVKGSPFKVQVLEMPEWGCEEVAMMFDQNALSDYTAAVLARDIRGFMLPDMTAEVMDAELGIKTKVHQNKFIMTVKGYMGVDELVWDDYQYPDAHMLVQMGVNGNRNAWRMSELLSESEYQTALAGFADGEDFLNRRMQVIPVHGFV